MSFLLAAGEGDQGQGEGCLRLHFGLYRLAKHWLACLRCWPKQKGFPLHLKKPYRMLVEWFQGMVAHDRPETQVNCMFACQLALCNTIYTILSSIEIGKFKTLSLCLHSLGSL